MRFYESQNKTSNESHNTWAEVRCHSDLFFANMKYTGSQVQSAMRLWLQYNSAESTGMNRVFLIVDCAREFYVRVFLLRHSLIHKACMHHGKTSPNHKWKQAVSSALSREEALKPWLKCSYVKWRESKCNCVVGGAKIKAGCRQERVFETEASRFCLYHSPSMLWED